MSHLVVLDELHVTFRIPAPLPAPAVRAIRRTLAGPAFAAAVRRAVLAVMRERSALKTVRATISH